MVCLAGEVGRSAFALHLLNEGIQVTWQLVLVEVRCAMQDDRRKRLLLLGCCFHVLELHVLQFLDHALVIGLRLLENLTADLFLLWCKELVQEKVVASENPAQTENQCESTNKGANCLFCVHSSFLSKL